MDDPACGPLLGLVPMGKFVFSHEDALEQKGKIQDLLPRMGVRYVDIDDVVSDGMVRDQSHVEPVVREMQKQGVEALFMPHCNFGTEGACGMIARELEVPVLLWGPRDEAPLPDGTRSRDSLCGLFATSKVLDTLGVHFSYIENCTPENPRLEEGLNTFLGAASVVSAPDHVRIGMAGAG